MSSSPTLHNSAKLKSLNSTGCVSTKSFHGWRFIFCYHLQYCYNLDFSFHHVICSNLVMLRAEWDWSGENYYFGFLWIPYLNILFFNSKLLYVEDFKCKKDNDKKLRQQEHKRHVHFRQKEYHNRWKYKSTQINKVQKW